MKLQNFRRFDEKFKGHGLRMVEHLKKLYGKNTKTKLNKTNSKK